MPLITFKPSGVIVNAPAGTLLLDAARAAGLPAELPCGGRGVCGKCLARLESGRLDFADTGVMPPGLAGEGYVLICRARLIDEPVTVRLLAQLDREKGQFTGAADDRLLVEASLLPQPGDIDPAVRKVRLQVAEPMAGDGLSDADRLERAVLSEFGGRRAELTLPALRALPGALRQRGGAVTAAVHSSDSGARILDVEPGDTVADLYGVAVDIGTTTVAVQLVNLRDGRVLDARTAYNAQIECGLDIISRINYARQPQRLAELRERVLGTVNGLTAALAQASGVDARHILGASVAGNTTMTHLILGIPPETIRLDPYTPAVYRVPQYSASDVGLAGVHPDAPVHFAPSVGSYVGGDITSGLLCTALSTESDEVRLFIDIGTNGELILGNADFLLGCACSAGPAFEGGGIDCGMRASRGAVEWVEVDRATGLPSVSTIGNAQPAGICGSGLISLVANLFESGWIDAAGKLDRSRPCGAIEAQGKSARYVVAPAREGGRSIHITEADIENLIRAKAAIFSACRVMLRKVSLGFEDLACIYIAGGFGRYLDIEKATAIGLIPDVPREKFRFIGNSSVTGAAMTLVSAGHRRRQLELASRITYLDLGAEPEYMDEYTAALFLPHTDRRLFTGNS